MPEPAGFPGIDPSEAQFSPPTLPTVRPPDPPQAPFVGPPYASVVDNLFATGLHRAVFRTSGESARGTMEVNELDFSDRAKLDGMVQNTKALGSLGTLVGERASKDLLRLVCRHPSDPFKLVGFASYEPTDEDLAVVAHGSLDGERAVWDQLIVPNLSGLGISTDPGVVPRSPFVPDEGAINKPLPINQQDPAVRALYLSIDALRALAGYHVILTQTSDVPPRPLTPPQVLPITDTEEWHRLVIPILAGPFMSGV